MEESFFIDNGAFFFMKSTLESYWLDIILCNLSDINTFQQFFFLKKYLTFYFFVSKMFNNFYQNQKLLRDDPEVTDFLKAKLGVNVRTPFTFFFSLYRHVKFHV